MMRVAVISPYYKESEKELKRCRDSVASQTHPCVHFFVSDGHPNEIIDDWDVIHIRLPNHSDYGDTPRALAAMSAAVRGFDAVSFLDADNWYEPNHIASLISLCEKTGASVATSGRMLRRPDGSILSPCYDSDGETFIDTNCYLITRVSFNLFPVWIYKEKQLACIGDRVFWRAVLRSGCKRAHSPEYSVNYASLFAGHYIRNGEAPPPGAKVMLTSEDGKSFKITSYAEILEKEFRTFPWRLPSIIMESVPRLLQEARSAGKINDGSSNDRGNSSS